MSRGAKPQRPLWASTGTKNPDYSDVLYVAELIGSDVINTMPEQTLHAFADHGDVAAPSTPIPPAPRRRSLMLLRPESTSAPSPPSSSAKACSHSATPTASCSTASIASSGRWRPPLAEAGFTLGLRESASSWVATAVPSIQSVRPVGVRVHTAVSHEPSEIKPGSTLLRRTLPDEFDAGNDAGRTFVRGSRA